MTLWKEVYGDIAIQGKSPSFQIPIVLMFSNSISCMVKTLTFYVIVTQICTMSLKGLSTLVLKLHDLFFETYLILMRVENQKTTANSKVRVIEQICLIDPEASYHPVKFLG